ncbi:MAG: DUF2508 domain-containing protein [Oscillospiraceae bacterium]|nr:DUF2508 domain-containing protein [Oscillospiraceae bacterium]
MSKRKERRAAREQREQARLELLALQDDLRSAYAAFQRTADPALTEAAILEIGALQSRYGRSLQTLKALYG